MKTLPSVLLVILTFMTMTMTAVTAGQRGRTPPTVLEPSAPEAGNCFRTVPPDSSCYGCHNFNYLGGYWYLCDAHLTPLAVRHAVYFTTVTR